MLTVLLILAGGRVRISSGGISQSVELEVPMFHFPIIDIYIEAGKMIYGGQLYLPFTLVVAT